MVLELERRVNRQEQAVRDLKTILETTACVAGICEVSHGYGGRDRCPFHRELENIIERMDSY